jgi:pilus assembly protein CpaE
LARSNVSVQSGGIDGATTYLADNPTPNLLIVQTTETGDGMFAALERLSGVVDPDSRVILLGQENDIGLYRKLIEMGLSDYFTGQVGAEQLLGAIESIFAQADATESGRVIACIGTRGGAGSSSVAANLAHSLGQQFEEQVILIDLDMSFGTAAMALNLQQRQSLADALAQPSRLDDVLMERFMLKYDDHLSVVAAPVTLGANEDINLESFEILLNLVRQMAAFVVLDMPHLWHNWVSEVLLHADEVVVVTYPDLANLRDAKNIFDTVASKRGVGAPTRLAFNRVGNSRKTELTAKDFESTIGESPVVTIPFDPVLFGTAINNGEMVAQVNKGSKTVQEFDKLANIVSARSPVAAAAKKSMLSLFKGTN